MENKKDLMEQIITEDLLNEADAIDREIESMEIEVPKGLKEEMKKGLHAQIDEYEKENVYAKLSEEDRKALELGRELIQDKKVYRKKSKKMYVALIAVAVLVLAMGVTSIGGAERIAEMIGIPIGDREIVRIEADENNYIETNEDEENAYQELKDVFGIEVVKIVHWPGEVFFLSAEIDEDLQMALFKYEYKEKNISYYINAFYKDSSWGSDVEDTITDQYSIEHENCIVEIKEYEKPESKIKRYSAKYTYKGIEYYLIGVMEKEEFEFIIKNLKFF